MGSRVRTLIETYEDSIAFSTPDICFEDSGEYVSEVLISRGVDPACGIAALDQLRSIIQIVDRALYRDFEQPARERMAVRDIEDWPIAAVALMLGVPISTEDHHFFGAGLATCTTDRVELYLHGRPD